MCGAIMKCTLSLIAMVVFCGSMLIAAPPRVISVSPTPQSLSALSSSQIVVMFDSSLNPSSVNSTTVSVFGKWTGVVTGTISLENNNTILRFNPLTRMMAGDWITVSLSKGIRSMAGENMASGYMWNFWIKTASATMALVETQRIPVRRTGEGHIQTYGAHGIDLNKDGYSDFFVPNEITNDARVFINNGSGSYSTFSVHPISGGSRPSTNESADFNLDGNPDIAVGNSTGDSVTVFLGNGNGGFLSIKNYKAAGGIRGLAVCDADGDGDTDIITANRSGNNVAILLNNGNGTFASPVLLEAGGNGETACVVADANKDGIPDLFVGAYASSEIILLLGNGNGGFTFSSKVNSGGGGPWMIAVGDMNGDGNVDVVSANSNGSNTAVILGNGAGGLSPAVTYQTGGFPLAIDVGDIDGDGDLDLVTSNYSGRSWSVFENNGSGILGNRRTLPASRAGSCATLHDRDNDGDMDMTGIDEEDDLIFIFENRQPTSVQTHSDIPQRFHLYPNYPNPFNPTTEIRMDLPFANEVTLIVYDLLGREVKKLFESENASGSLSVHWDGRNESGVDVASGTYIARLVATGSKNPSGHVIISRGLVLLR